MVGFLHLCDAQLAVLPRQQLIGGVAFRLWVQRFGGPGFGVLGFQGHWVEGSSCPEANDPGRRSQ